MKTVYQLGGNVIAFLGLWFIIDPTSGVSQIANLNSQFIGLGLTIFGTGWQIIGAILEASERRLGA